MPLRDRFQDTQKKRDVQFIRRRMDKSLFSGVSMRGVVREMLRKLVAVSTGRPAP